MPAIPLSTATRLRGDVCAKPVTVAPITTIRSLSTEVSVGAANGLTEPSIVSCENITTIPKALLRDQIGVLLDSQEPALSLAIAAAFDLD
jgi:mRNA interferase MazF